MDGAHFCPIGFTQDLATKTCDTGTVSISWFLSPPPPPTPPHLTPVCNPSHLLSLPLPPSISLPDTVSGTLLQCALSPHVFEIQFNYLGAPASVAATTPLPQLLSLIFPCPPPPTPLPPLYKLSHLSHSSVIPLCAHNPPPQ